jgi:hypothetical protein
MTTFQKPPSDPPPPPRHEVALWSGVAAFFASLLAIGIFDLLNPDQWQEYLGSLLVAAITAGSVYAKERLNYAKREEQAHGDSTPPQ